MSTPSNNVWYHCGRCGSLFESALEYDENRLCSECGQTPVIGSKPIKPLKAIAPEPVEVKEFTNEGEAVSKDGERRAVKKKRRSNTMMKVVVIWTFLLLIAVWLRHHYTKIDDDAEAQERVAAQMSKGSMADERVALLTEALPECHRMLNGFLAAGTPEERNQYVVQPIETAGKMAIFYTYNSFPVVDLEHLSRIDQEVIRVGDTWMIMTRWKEENGAEFDAVFRRHAGEWRLDWDHFNQYGEYSWPLFLAGEGPDEVEFRLLARQRHARSEKERAGSRIRLNLYAPVFGKPKEASMSSPDLTLDRNSDDGLLLDAATARREEGKPVFGQRMLPMEAPGFVQLRATVKRSELGGNRHFTIEKIHACHWLDSDVVGFDLDELRDEMFGN